MNELSPAAAALLAAIARVYGGEAATRQALARMSPVEIDALLNATASQAAADPDDVAEARAALLDLAAEKRHDLTAVIPGGGRVPDDTRLADDLPDQDPRLDGRLDRPDVVRDVTEARRLERNRLLREEEQRRAERARLMLPFNRTPDEIRNAQVRASGLYRALLDPDGDPTDPENYRPDEPLGGGRSIPTNPERELQRRTDNLAGAATPDRVAREATTIPEARVPLYYAGDEYAPAGWSEQRIAAMQRQLVEAGLLLATFRRGYWDGATADAYATLLVEANQTGDTWRDTLPHVQRAYEQGLQADRAEAIRSFRGLIPAYTPEDRESLRQTVRDAIRRRVGRDPSAAELATYTAELDAHYRAQYDTEVAEARRRIEEQISQIGNERDVGRAILDGAPPAPPVGDLPVPAANAPAVDPQARLDAALDRALAGEVELLDDKAQAAQSQQTVSQIAGGLLRRVR